MPNLLLEIQVVILSRSISSFLEICKYFRCLFICFREHFCHWVMYFNCQTCVHTAYLPVLCPYCFFASHVSTLPIKTFLLWPKIQFDQTFLLYIILLAYWSDTCKKNVTILLFYYSSIHLHNLLTVF
jgi:hypothetical protein